MDAGGTDSSDSVSPEEVLACEAPFAQTFTLNHTIPRPARSRVRESKVKREWSTNRHHDHFGIEMYSQKLYTFT